MIGGLTIIGLFIGLYFGFDTDESRDGTLERDASSRVLRCQYGYDLINGKCIDIDECIENLGNDFKMLGR